MKYIFSGILILFSSFAWGQRFMKMTESPIGTVPSDSRSVNIVDVNQDGWEDIFISNGKVGGENDLLYINKGDGTFRQETGSAIAQDKGTSVGATFGDFDRDGDLDAYVTNWYGGVNQMYLNDGKGVFAKTEIPIMKGLTSFSETASWGDYDKDGWLDMYVTNSEGVKRNFLFRNLANGDFEMINRGSLVVKEAASRNINWVDFDGDGDLDIYVSNETNQTNDLYRNDGEIGFLPVNEGIGGGIKSSMSSSWGDIDNDGDLDLFVANAGFFQEQNNGLYRNIDGNYFLAIDEAISTDGGCSFGSNFGDYDNDGDLDLIVTNGFCNGNLRNFLYENQGDGTFFRRENILPLLSTVCSYGAAWGDLNNDGFLDLVIANCKNNNDAAAPNNDLFMNQGNDNNWLKVKLTGTMSDIYGIGAKVKVKANIGGVAAWQMREISAQSGYCGQNSLIAHVGLGDAQTVDSLMILWPSGYVQVQTELNPNQQVEITESMTTKIKEELSTPSFSLKLYPNPVGDTFKLEIQRDARAISQAISLKLFNRLGQVVWQEEVADNAQIFTTSVHVNQGKLIPGLYHLHARIGQDSLVKKLEVL